MKEFCDFCAMITKNGKCGYNKKNEDISKREYCKQADLKRKNEMYEEAMQVMKRARKMKYEKRNKVLIFNMTNKNSWDIQKEINVELSNYNDWTIKTFHNIENKLIVALEKEGYFPIEEEEK